MDIYESNSLVLRKTSLVFQTWSGARLSSSAVGVRFRGAFCQMGISYSGTITDLRKAAATLTGIYYPELHEKMSNFMCHRSTVHHKHYRILMGHYGLTKPFLALEKMQTNPFSSNFGDIDYESISNNSFMDESLEKL